MRRAATGLAMLVLAVLAPGSHGDAAPRSDHRWIASWGAAQLAAEGDTALPPAQMTDTTVRQTVHLSAGGDRVRVRISNLFGGQPLLIDAAAAALPTGGPRVDRESMRALTFAGRSSVTVPAGAELYSDPVALPVRAGGDLSISLHFPQLPARQTGHPGSRTTSYTLAGNHVADPDLPGAQAVERWYAISDVEVRSPAAARTIVTIGDSITDGHGVAVDTNRRWPDRLAERLRASPALRGFGVVNTGIGGNRVLNDGIGPNLLARFDRDVIARAGVRYAVVLEGVNDLGVLTRDAPVTPQAHAAMVAAITGAYREVVARAHAHGISVIGGTIMPFASSGYYHPGLATEADRQAVNAFIRSTGTFDAVVDFDRVMRDPAHPDRLAPAFDSGDGLHPSEAGYRAMADAVPLSIFSTRGPDAELPVAALAADVGPALAPAPAERTAGPAIALTFDDLPAHGPLPPGVSRLDIVRTIIAALKAHDAPAFGFLNGGFGVDDPQSPAVLAAWRAAGLPLGNHSWSHLNLNTNDPATFAADVARNEPLLRARVGDADWHWLRYPFLAEGDTPAKRDAVRGALRQQGYKVAAVTMSFDDWKWSDPYARCVAKRDNAAIVDLETRFLSAAREDARRARAMSAAVYGRDIPYVLLMHLGAFDARMLPRLLDLYRSEGFRFVTLPQAESDPFYRTAVDLALPGPSPTLFAAAAAKNLANPSTPLPAPAENACG
jgi:lysophospholipase L1-like esterase/peptidoglycan/xylan/chitin deacetylase (PgdA/CDA1 family)